MERSLKVRIGLNALVFHSSKTVTRTPSFRLTSWKTVTWNQQNHTRWTTAAVAKQYVSGGDKSYA